MTTLVIAAATSFALGLALGHRTGVRRERSRARKLTEFAAWFFQTLWKFEPGERMVLTVTHNLRTYSATVPLRGRTSHAQTGQLGWPKIGPAHRATAKDET